MKFADRLRELCERGEQVDAITLAKANLMNERDVTVAVDGSSVIVETPHFQGAHRWSVDAQNEIRLDRRGAYRCTVDGADLSLSTATMNRRAVALAYDELERRTARRPPPVASDGGSSRSSGTPAPVGRELTSPDQDWTPTEGSQVGRRGRNGDDARSRWSLLGHFRRRIAAALA